MGGNYDVKRTACRHEATDYIDKYQGMSEEQVDAAIMPLLRAAERSFSRSLSLTPASRRPGPPMQRRHTSDDNDNGGLKRGLRGQTQPIPV